MNGAPAYKERRRAVWLANSTALDYLLAKGPFDEHWERPSDLPAVPATETFSYGLACVYAGDDVRSAMFFERAIKYANRLEDENRFHDTEVAEAGYPLSHAEVIRARALAQWILDGLLPRTDRWSTARPLPAGMTHDFSRLPRSDFRKAAELYVEWCLTKAEDRKRFSSSLTMSDYLQGVRCALMANELDYASELLGTNQPLLWHHGGERGLWRQLAETYPAMNTNLRGEIESFFDRVRDPDFHEVLDGLPTSIDRDALALDTGIIRQRYLINATAMECVDPRAVIEAVAY